MNIYISSSWKNRVTVRLVATALRNKGYEVYDFTDPTCRTTPEIPPEAFPEQFDPNKHSYAEYLNRVEWHSAVTENRAALDACDVVLLLLPCGIDATADWAYAVGQGKQSIVFGHPRAGERSPVHLWAELMTESWEDVYQQIEEWTWRPSSGPDMPYPDFESFAKACRQAIKRKSGPRNRAQLLRMLAKHVERVARKVL